LYSTANAYIEDITISTDKIDYDDQHIPTSAILNYSIVIA